MRLLSAIVTAIFVQALILPAAHAHPGAGIVVDDRGQIYFTYFGVVRVDPHGQHDYVFHATDGHWLALDPLGAFARAQPKYFRRITPDGARPALIFAGGGSPIALDRDGELYYASGPDDFSPGGLDLVRESPDGHQTHCAPALRERLAAIHDGITALAGGPDGAIYAASWTGVFKVTRDGQVSTIAQPIQVDDCDPDPADHGTTRPLPYLRGLAVAGDGVIYAAATSCHRLLKITPAGQVSIALKCERPWTPTGVALRDKTAFVLEITNANGPRTEGWRPRIRQLTPDGTVTTILSLPEQPTSAPQSSQGMQGRDK